MRLRIHWCAPLCGLLLLACGDETTDPACETSNTCGSEAPRLDSIEVAGEYDDSFGTRHTVSATDWTQTFDGVSSVYTFREVDNDADYALAENAATNEFNPGLFSRFDWTTVGGELWFCQTAYDAASLEAARATAPADATDPANSGCGGFAWSRLAAPAAPVAMELAGEYTDPFGTTHTVSDESWIQAFDGASSTFLFVQISNDENWAVAENAASNEYNPGLFSRFDWADVDGTLWFCQTAYDAATAEAAAAVTAADAADPENSGCGGFSWSRLDPVVR